MSSFDYDYVLLGGGSGGVSSAKRAAMLYNKKVAVVEGNRWGGTCVNVGCVPKKLMFLAASLRDSLRHDCPQYGFTVPEDATEFDWATVKKKRDAYIVRLNGIYENGLKNNDVDIFEGWGSFVDAHTLSIAMKDGSTKTISADKIVVATGGKPMIPPGKGVEENIITSDGFFELEALPKKVVVVGAGYIAVELAGVLNALGSETHLVVRKGKALREFDPDISDALDAEYLKAGITIHRNTNGVAQIDVVDGKKKVTMHNGEVIDGADEVLMAPGRVPMLDGLNLDKAGVKLKEGKGYIEVDEFQNTNVENIYALGDVCGRVELTPMAIAAGRRLADRLFGPAETYAKAKASYDNVPTVVFSHPPIGGCGLTEPQAVAKYGQDNIKIYKSKFANLFYGLFDVEPDQKPKTFMKIITAGAEEQVVGIHVLGMGADEMMQGFGVAMKMGCTKADLDSCVAIHPTASEELVTMGTWGTSPQVSGAAVPPVLGAPSKEPTLQQSKM